MDVAAGALARHQSLPSIIKRRELDLEVDPCNRRRAAISAVSRAVLGAPDGKDFSH